jgi:hypothetical protein
MDNNVRSWPSIYIIREGKAGQKEPWKNKGGQGFTAEAVAAAFAAGNDSATAAIKNGTPKDAPLQDGTTESLAAGRNVLEVNAKDVTNGEPSLDRKGVDEDEDDRHDNHGGTEVCVYGMVQGRN